ncbi:hypothetical protein HELRODRAFT_183037 [Helobdella robusta]|uniref:Uncharacterized protein n=1 Tax=Helobdella robusta TaxID=6412 RepID=T1FJ34_HELRO|nr:hypothetical protein HELRODRAFT_183037 [Helobdella robusta]ESN89918.1 hypothetical protein HELRODRAFT_183037 [Helobdella robusta]
MEKKGTAMSLRRSEFHSDRPKNLRLVNTGGEYISPEFKSYLLNKPHIYRDYVKEIKSPNVVEKSPVVKVSPLVRAPPCKKKGKTVSVSRPLTSRVERLRYGITEEGVEEDDSEKAKERIKTERTKKRKISENLRKFVLMLPKMIWKEVRSRINEEKEQLATSADFDLDEAIKRQRRRMMLDHPHPRHDTLRRNRPMLEKYKLFDDQSSERTMPKDESDSKEEK